MVPQFVDALILLSFSGGLVLVGAIGILALPWREQEMDETVHAVRTAWRLLDRGLHTVSGRTPAEGQAPRGSVAGEAVVAFERPPITRVPLA
ncbi:MAG: hypothetical protein H6732_09670 [Alphaproteobacteria bacterium]|nr:hypothetical protein [Alphaproteobacteria bacterium]